MDLFSQVKKVRKKMEVHASFFEIYGGKCRDLFNDKNEVKILEDKNGTVNMLDMKESVAKTGQELIDLIEYGFSIRQTHSTTHNDTSSRSHAICRILLKEDEESEDFGQLFIVDLAVK